jgi:hypothetical protein
MVRSPVGRVLEFEGIGDDALAGTDAGEDLLEAFGSG